MRIASLLPSATEIVCALGLEDSLVAVTHECDYPAAVRDKPIVTRSVLPGDSASADIDRHIRELLHQGSGIYRLDADRLTALRPDLILTQELCEVCAVSYPIVERAARLNDAQPHLVSLEPETLADVFDHIRLIGRLTSREVRAEQVVAGLEHRLAAVQHRIAGRPVRRVVLLEWVAPPFNCGHWTPGLIAHAGGRDLLGSPGRPAHAIDWRDVVEARPEIVVISACGFSLERSASELRAAAAPLDRLAGEVWVVDGNAFFSRPGPRLVDSVEILAGILHPDSVPPAAPNVARRQR
ncbi:MAG: cobalamin-binding protein [Chloroflexi bacterium]|nr:MAG: cobalamin-binding protein [Chloroflexota bacterium]